MIELLPWIDRRWTFGLQARVFPALLERLRGTAARARALVADMPDEQLSACVPPAWSSKEHIGHLDDLHDLDERRLDEFLARVEALSSADMTNQRTRTAAHNAVAIGEILDRFERHREPLVARMEALSESDVEIASMHPRLRQPVRLIDWAYFVAEHDDHHLAQARRALVRARG